jgi:hypothetical protein
LGENWSKATSGIPSTLFVNTIKTIGEYIYVGGFPGLFLSSNGGSSWAYKGFNTREITAIEGYDDIVFVGASDFFTGSVFVSTNRGNTWSDYGDGLPNNTLFKLAIVDTVLFSGLYGYGAWNTSAIVTEVQNSYYPLPTDFLLYQNYPNPFNPSTKIRYSVPQTSNVIMKVFDVLGNEIETLIDEEKNTGTYEITWFADNLPSGIYFYRLQADSFVESKKMVLLK